MNKKGTGYFSARRAPVVCWPHSLVQGHAAWHTLGAVATVFLWRYLRPALTEPAAAAPRAR